MDFWWADQLRAERAAKDWSREQLAEASGIAVSTIRRMEDGERAGTIDNLAAICRALGLPVSEFFVRAEQRRAADELATHRNRRRNSPTVQKKAARSKKDPDA